MECKVDKEEEKSLIQMIKAGNYRQFERLIAEYQNPLFLFIWRMVRDEDDAKDLCQDTFFKAYKSLKSFREDSKFSSWLFQIGYRKALDLIAKRKRLHILLNKMETRSEMSSSEKDFEVKEANAFIGQIVDGLHQNSRIALHLFYKEEMTYGEIAVVMKVPINTVKSHIHRGKEIIREKLIRMNRLRKQPT
jgi:RNA polymerase sigma-70 factor (ECF subfamily)